MEVAAAAEVRRMRDIEIVISENNQQEQSRFPPLIAESLEILYVSIILYSILITPLLRCSAQWVGWVNPGFPLLG